MNATLSILLINKIPIVRKGIRSILERSSERPVIIFEADNYPDAKNIVASGACHFVVLDVDAAKQFYLDKNIDLPHLLVYKDFDRDLCDKIRSTESNGFIPVVSRCEVFSFALDSIRADQPYYLEAAITENNLSQRPPLENHSDAMDILLQLTKREQQILDMILDELTHDEMAEKLNVSRRTVEGHKHNLTKKLNVKSMIGLTRLAIKSGRIS